MFTSFQKSAMPNEIPNILVYCYTVQFGIRYQTKVCKSHKLLCVRLRKHSRGVQPYTVTERQVYVPVYGYANTSLIICQGLNKTLSMNHRPIIVA